MFDFIERVRAAHALTNAAQNNRRFQDEDLKALGLPSQVAKRLPRPFGGNK